MAPYTKPETVLRRSDELLSVGQPMAALSSISEIFSSKRFRQTPLSSLEPIMIRFLDLCVDLRKGRTAKEGLHMYKNVAQNTSVQSVEMVIQHFVKKSKGKLDEALAKVDEIEGPAEDAAAKTASADATTPANPDAVADANATEAKDAPAEKTVGVDVEDLEASETPEGLLLSMVSDEKSRDRTYRELVTPWLRGLWEAYRTALDILRNNSRLEAVYQQIATEAFSFCLAHGRKTEFRRLSETLRANLAASQKYTHQTHAINLSDPDVLQRHLDTRFQQLNTAVELELWQEAFRTAEDIHGLIGMSKKAPKASVMASFYEKMTKVFGVGQNFLFHAAAYNKYHSLVQASTTDEAQSEKLASAVLVSALAVPVGGGLGGGDAYGRRREGDETEARGKLGRLAALLGLSTAPTRQGLLRDALGRGALKKASKDVRALYEILEVDFHPLSITNKIEPILERLAADPETERYVGPLKEVVLSRLFQQLAQVYDSLKLARIIKLASFESTSGAGEGSSSSSVATRARVEKFVMEACRRGELEITLDHAAASVRFADRKFENESAAPAASTSSGDSVAILQPSSATLLQTRLTRLATSLATSLDTISPSFSPLAHALSAQTAALAALATEVPKQRKALLKRKTTIEERKRRTEEAAQKRDREEAQARAQRAAQVAEEQQARIARQNRERELRKVQEEAEKIRAKEREKVMKAVAESAGVKLDSQSLANADTNTIIAMGVEQIEKDKTALAAKLKSVNKRLDHTERALRREEIPLLEQDYVEQQARDKTAHAENHQDLVATMRAQHEQEVAIKARLARLMPDYQVFRDVVAKRRGVDFAAAEEQARKKIAAAKAKRKQEVLQRRAAERAQREEEERLEREREEQERVEREEREKEEEERAARQAEIEEEERKFREAAEAKAKAAREERDKERAAAQEAAAKQRQREEEAEQRRKERSGGAATRPPVPGSGAWRANRGAGDSPAASATPPETPSPSATPAPAPESRRTVIGGGRTGGWRDRVAAQEAGGASSTPSAPAAPAAAPATASPPPPTSQSPAPDGPPRRFASGAGGGGWRERMEAKKGGAAPQANGENNPDEIRRTTSQGGAYRAPGAGGSGRTASGAGQPRDRKW